MDVVEHFIEDRNNEECSDRQPELSVDEDIDRNRLDMSSINPERVEEDFISKLKSALLMPIHGNTSVEQDIDLVAMEDDEMEPLKETVLTEKKEKTQSSSATVGRTICRLCYVSQTSELALNQHIDELHEGEKYALEGEIQMEDLVYTCQVCPLKFLSQNILNGHQILQHGLFSKEPKIVPKPFKCRLCYTPFERNRDIIRHEKVHKEDQAALNLELSAVVKSFECIEIDCGMRFVSIHILNYHFNIVHKTFEFGHLRKTSYNAKVRRYECPLCYVMLQSFNAMHRHIMNIHEEEKNILMSPINPKDLIHQCNKCDGKFVSTLSLNYHSTVFIKLLSLNISGKLHSMLI